MPPMLRSHPSISIAHLLSAQSKVTVSYIHIQTSPHTSKGVRATDADCAPAISRHPCHLDHEKSSPTNRCSSSTRCHLAKTLTTPSPPALTTSLPSELQHMSQTPSPRIARCEMMSCVQIRFSRDQNRILASWPADTASLPSFDNDRAEIAPEWATMLYVHWPKGH